MNPSIFDVASRVMPKRITSKARGDAEKRGETMPGGKFPIRNKGDLANAKHDVGRASDPAAARTWINKRAKELGAAPLGGEKKKRTLRDIYAKRG